jgi:alpha-tubulin suppressor-like RCC1 family protein
MRRAAAIITCVVTCAAIAPVGATAATSPGELLAFGSNLHDQLGVTTNAGLSNANATPLPVAIPASAGTATLSATSATSSLVATSSGGLYAFGDNLDYELGSTTPAASATPELVTLPSRSGAIIAVGTGVYDAAALTSSGQIFTFGNNSAAQLGYTANGTGNLPAVVTPFTGQNGTVTQLSVGSYSMLALTSTGQIFGWGDGNNGELGSSGIGASNTPVQIQVPGLSGSVARVVAGDSDSFVLSTTGQLFSFGDDNNGQLGYSSAASVNATPTQVTFPAGAGTVTQVAAGHDFTYALTSSGQVYAFGINDCGQLGSNSGGSPTPVAVSAVGAGPIASIQADYDFAMLLTNKGQVYSAGCNYYGQLGNVIGNGTSMPQTSFSFAGSFPLGTTIDSLGTGGYSQGALVTVADLAVPDMQRMTPAQLGVPYTSSAPASSGGAAPLTWSASGLPPGLAINPSTGQLTGTATQPGSFFPTFTATDADGIQASGGIDVSVLSAPAAPVTVTAFSQSHSRWREGRRQTRPALPRGTTFNVTLSGSAIVVLTFARQVSGRMVHGRCVAQTHANRHHHTCTRAVSAGTVSFSGHTGANTFAFTGKLANGHTLPHGRYVVTAQPTAATRSLTFTIS